MRSKYLSKAEDLEVGDIVLYDGNEMDPVRVVYLGQVFATVESDGKPFDIMRDRLTKCPTDQLRAITGGTAAMNSDKLDAAREQLQAERTAKKSGNESYIAGQNQAFDRAIEIVTAAAQNTWHDIEKDGLPEKEGEYLVTVDTAYNRERRSIFVTEQGFCEGEWETEDVVAWRPKPQPYRKGDE